MWSPWLASWYCSGGGYSELGQPVVLPSSAQPWLCWPPHSVSQQAHQSHNTQQSQLTLSQKLVHRLSGPAGLHQPVWHVWVSPPWADWIFWSSLPPSGQLTLWQENQVSPRLARRSDLRSGLLSPLASTNHWHWASWLKWERGSHEVKDSEELVCCCQPVLWDDNTIKPDDPGRR